MIIIFVLIVIGTVIWVGLPFLDQSYRQSSQLVDQEINPLQELQNKKERLLQTIRELDFDYETGKISVPDYKMLRADIESETVKVLKEIEQTQILWNEMEDSIQ